MKTTSTFTGKDYSFCFYFIFYFSGALSCIGQIPGQKNPPAYIKSVIFEASTPNTYTPVIALGEVLNFSFDDLEGDQKYYYYKIEHYDYNWVPSKLMSTEFASGFPEDRIRKFENSFNTLQPYTHYRLTIPNENLRLKISGNYVLSVLDDRKNVVFSRRFIVYEPRVDVVVTVHRSRDIQNTYQKQDVEFIINHPNLNLRDHSQEIQVAVYKNWDWNSVRKNIAPKYVRNNQLMYNYVSEISYWGDNEYLYFDTKEIRNASVRIQKTRLEDIFNTYLYTDLERANRAYTFNPDVNGNFVVRTLDSDNQQTEPDYSRVYFSLETTVDPGNKNIYIYGNYNNWALGEDNKMHYNPKTKLYEATMLFKQGFYNYLYVLADQNQIDTRAIEGTFYETENEYSVVVYYKAFGDRYTQVVGIGSANSTSLKN